MQKTKLEKCLSIDVDYILLTHDRKQKQEGSGGHNIQKIMMTLDAFKYFCLLAETELSKQIRKYFVVMEKILHEHIQEQTQERHRKELLIATFGKKTKMQEMKEQQNKEHREFKEHIQIRKLNDKMKTFEELEKTKQEEAKAKQLKLELQIQDKKLKILQLQKQNKTILLK